MTEYEIKCAGCEQSSGIKFEKPAGQFGEFWHCEECTDKWDKEFKDDECEYPSLGER